MMLYVILLTVVMLAFLDRATRLAKVDYLKAETRFNLFALRDELRNAAIEGQVQRNNWFDYMDTTLTAAIERLDAFTFLGWLALAFRHREDTSLLQAQENLDRALNSPSNEKM